ncbi:hypothetical protein Aperf_G00000113686 [Anoplocephala perfoliata]
MARRTCIEQEIDTNIILNDPANSIQYHGLFDNINSSNAIDMNSICEDEIVQSEMYYQPPYSFAHAESVLQEMHTCQENQHAHIYPIRQIDSDLSSEHTLLNGQNLLEYPYCDYQQTSDNTPSLTHILTDLSVVKTTNSTIYPSSSTAVAYENSVEACAENSQSDYTEEHSGRNILHQDQFANQCNFGTSHPETQSLGFNQTQSFAHLHDANGGKEACCEASFEASCDCDDSTAVAEISWSIYDEFLPEIDSYDTFDEWPDGDLKRIYAANNTQVIRHKCGWAMDDCNNHNATVLKKSCLGILKCSENCIPPGGPIIYRPAVAKCSRLKQIREFTCTCILRPTFLEQSFNFFLIGHFIQSDRPCSTPGCEGKLEHCACGGNAGYPVVHYWRLYNGKMYFEAKGHHDHARPYARLPNTRGSRIFQL